MDSIQAVRGMNDMMPDQVGWWQKVENAAREVLENFRLPRDKDPRAGKAWSFLHEVSGRAPILSKKRCTPSRTQRRSDWPCVRRPRLQIVRSYVQHALHADSATLKLYEIGPMFGTSVLRRGATGSFTRSTPRFFGSDSPMIDAEMMHMLTLFFDGIGISGVILNINTLGCPECRKNLQGNSERISLRHKETGFARTACAAVKQTRCAFSIARCRSARRCSKASHADRSHRRRVPRALRCGKGLP